ncbi:PREDICTED: thylakoid lumenal 16.5 kDa protein, chloroplastic [Tarenaya hassleriana]|uniref:thylakoid lumenal 16.5 kDa protein, chloroplastic n=1 Tax=Tarenaya hassleriana TaxID=28532 RepID=UPI00053C35DD|nr:PREDICTED: thylakoid lumenal 16.5 kDa protein, chloroplastic [Tarenaya hassleriana]
MAKTLISSTLNPFLSSSSSASSSSRTQVTILKAFSKNNGIHTSLSVFPSMLCDRRELSLGFMSSLVVGFLAGGDRRNRDANAAILEADDDEELLERVKQDRKKRIERQGVINSSVKEKGYLQDLVYKLSKVGQAIDNDDLSAAGSVLGGSTDTEWVKMVNTAFTKLSSSPEEKTQVETFNSSLASLISSVNKNDIESSKQAFVSSADAFEKWTAMTGLLEQLRGL